MNISINSTLTTKAKWAHLSTELGGIDRNKRLAKIRRDKKTQQVRKKTGKNSLIRTHLLLFESSLRNGEKMKVRMGKKGLTVYKLERLSTGGGNRPKASMYPKFSEDAFNRKGGLQWGLQTTWK